MTILTSCEVTCMRLCKSIELWALRCSGLLEIGNMCGHVNTTYQAKTVCTILTCLKVSISLSISLHPYSASSHSLWLTCSLSFTSPTLILGSHCQEAKAKAFNVGRTDTSTMVRWQFMEGVTKNCQFAPEIWSQYMRPVAFSFQFLCLACLCSTIINSFCPSLTQFPQIF